MGQIFRKIKKILLLPRPMARFRYAWRMAVAPAELHPIERYPDLSVSACVKAYLGNVDTAESLTKARGGCYLNVLQPYVSLQRPALSAFDVASTAHMTRRVCRDGTTENELMDRFYGALRKAAEGNGAVMDLSRMFDQRGDVFFDMVHVSDKGNDLIASEIARRLLAMGGTP
jgi:hypothetical protein